MPLTKASAAFLPALITAVVLFGGYGVVKLVQNIRAPSAPAASPSPTPHTPPPTPAASLTLPQVRADTDSDGLPDDLERIYQTDAKNPDTDGDGYQDGLEVANGYDPTKKAPGDKIAIPAPSPSPVPAASPRPPTFTEQFLARTKLPPDPKSVLGSEQLGGFVAEANVRGFLPEIKDADIRIVGEAGKVAVSRYLDAVSIPQNPRISPVSADEIAQSFQDLTRTGNAQPLLGIIGRLSQNVEELKKAPVPGETIALHKQFLAASTALRDNTQKLLDYRTDYVGALVASSRIENLRGVFRAIEDGIKTLEKKYGLT